MRRFASILILSVVVLSSSLLWASFASAQSQTVLTSEQEEQIKANCTSIKGSLNQLHASDAVLRVNRGQIYQSMARNLMDNFNNRLGSNGLDNKAMLTVTGNYRIAFTKFNTDYISYEQKVSQILRADCTNQPAQFYRFIEEARELRGIVHEDVKKMHQLIDDYRTSVNGFYLNYERLSN